MKAIFEILQEHYHRLDPILKKALQNFVRVHMADHVQDEENNDREFWVSFYNMPLIERMRDLKAGKLGRLVSFAGTVTRTSEVRPELYLATFKCNDCQQKVRNVEQQFKYTQPLICTNSTCGNRWLCLTRSLCSHKINHQQNYITCRASHHVREK